MVSFSDLPPLKPKYVEIENVTWISGRDKKAGTVFFPSDFDETLDVEFATNELLDYYGCSIANTRKDDVVIVEMRHAIQVPFFLTFCGVAVRSCIDRLATIVEVGLHCSMVTSLFCSFVGFLALHCDPCN